MCINLFYFSLHYTNSFHYRRRGSEWNVVHRSATIKNSLNPEWNEESIDLCSLCGGDIDLPLYLHIYDYESSGYHVSMGMIETSVTELVKAHKSSSKLKIKNKGETTGAIKVHTASVTGDDDDLEEEMSTLMYISESPVPTSVFTPPHKRRPPTFLDYIDGGCEMQLCVAIDFTGSNGDPRDRDSLHYQYPDGSLNDYEQAITSVGRILSDFDSDNKCPVWGKSLLPLYFQQSSFLNEITNLA